MKKNSILFFVLILLLLINPIKLFSADKKVQLAQLQQAGSERAMEWLWRLDSDEQLFPFLKIEFEQLLFMEKNANVQKQVRYLANSKVVTSAKQNYIACIELVGENTLSAEDKLFHYHIYGWTGEKIYTIEKMKPYDDPLWSIYLFNNGGALLTDGARGCVYLYNGKGKFTKKIDLFEDDIFDYEKPIECALAENGDVFVVAAQKRPMTREAGTSQLVSGEPWIICFNVDGEELWRKAIENPTFSRVAVSPSGDFFILAHNSLTVDNRPLLISTIFDKEGNSIFEIPFNFRFSVFSSDETQLFLADKKNVYHVDLVKKTYRNIFTVLHKQAGIITTIALDNLNNELMVLTAKSIFQNKCFKFVEANFQKINTAGEMLWNIDLDQDVIFTPSIHYENFQIAVGCESNYKIYRESRD